MKRLGYLGILLSYVILLTSAILFCSVLKDPPKMIIGICLVSGLILLFISMRLTEKGKNATENKVDKFLKILCMIPLYILLLPLGLLAVVFIIIDAIKNNFTKQTKPLKAKGFIPSKSKQNETVVYHFQKENCIIQIIPSALYQISFDGGTTFENIENTRLGTESEREDLKRIVYHYNSCDYRDRDMYEPTRHYVSFLIKNLP